MMDMSRNHRLDPRDTPGSWPHEEAYVGGFFIVLATKNRKLH